jgi:hypothetical protein
MRLKIIIICVAILAVALAAYLSFDKIVIFTLSKFYGINMSSTALSKDKANGYSFENLKVLNRRLGIGFFSARSNLRINEKTSILKSLDINFKFRDVHFIRSSLQAADTIYDSINKLVTIPFEDRWTYKDVSGTVEIFSNGLTLKNFAANGNEIRLSLSGDIYYDNTVDMDVTIYFSKEVLKDIPGELSSMIMKEEPQEWKSLSVKIKGDYHSPSLEVSGKLFRLNVDTVVMND